MLTGKETATGHTGKQVNDMEKKICRCLDTKIKCPGCGEVFGEEAYIQLSDKAWRIFDLSSNGEYLDYNERSCSPMEIGGTQRFNCSECDKVLKITEKQVIKIIHDYEKRNEKVK